VNTTQFFNELNTATAAIFSLISVATDLGQNPRHVRRKTMKLKVQTWSRDRHIICYFNSVVSKCSANNFINFKVSILLQSYQQHRSCCFRGCKAVVNNNSVLLTMRQKIINNSVWYVSNGKLLTQLFKRIIIMTATFIGFYVWRHLQDTYTRLLFYLDLQPSTDYGLFVYEFIDHLQ
jgi:hypothetical protein